MGLKIPYTGVRFPPRPQDFKKSGQIPYTGVRFPPRPQDFKKSGQNRYARVRVPPGPPENTECFLLAREKRAYARFVGRRKPERCASCGGGQRREAGSRPSARKRTT